MESTVKTGFGKVIIAVLCPPLYFFLRKKIIAGLIHSVIYIIALATIFFGVGVFFWAVGFIHAYWDLAHIKQEEVIQRQATVLAEKMADKQKA